MTQHAVVPHGLIWRPRTGRSTAPRPGRWQCIVAERSLRDDQGLNDHSVTAPAVTSTTTRATARSSGVSMRETGPIKRFLDVGLDVG